MTDREKEILRITNNAVCLDDNSDYGPALWEILMLLIPEKFENGEDYPELEYIKKGE